MRRSFGTALANRARVRFESDPWLDSVMRTLTITLLVAAASGSTGQAGEILRCVGAGGETMYTNLSCPANTQAQHVGSYEPVPDAPQPAYSRAAEEAALSASRAERAAQRAEAAAYRAPSYYEAAEEPERGGPYHQQEDNNVYYPAWFGGYPLFGSGNRNHHLVHHGAFARSGGGHHDAPRAVHPQPVKTSGGRQR